MSSTHTHAETRDSPRGEHVEGGEIPGTSHGVMATSRKEGRPPLPQRGETACKASAGRESSEGPDAVLTLLSERLDTLITRLSPTHESYLYRFSIFNHLVSLVMEVCPE
ncbi:hypothetical protein KIPB_008928, partial [Kipferlia bialata]|eukprot:g8928.t1